MLNPPTPKTDREMLIEIYAAVRNIQASIETLKSTDEMLTSTNAAHAERIGRLESWRGKLVAIGGAVGAALMLVAAPLVARGVQHLWP